MKVVQEPVDWRRPHASKFNAAILQGWEIRGTWLAFTSIVFADMRLAMKRCRSG
jgi:hypothetical protein